jgi:hypothetical protein
MAPSVTETITTTVGQASNGVAKLNLKQYNPTEAAKQDVRHPRDVRICLLHQTLLTSIALTGETAIVPILLSVQ